MIALTAWGHLMRVGRTVSVAATLALGLASPALAQPQSAAQADPQARIAALEEQVKALQQSIAELKGQVANAAPAPVPSWKGAPQLEDKKAGFSFKPKGLVQLDSGYAGFPQG